MTLLALNPGHHTPEDPGACGNNLQEADLTVILCDKIASHLAPYDVDVETIHENDLALICSKANTLNADYFCSVHINAGGGTGFESYVYTNASGVSRQLQDVIHGQIVSGFLAEQDIADRGRKQANFEVLRDTHMPAILLENLFIDNEADAAKLKNDAFLSSLANEIAFGLVKALGLKLKIHQPPSTNDGLSMAGTTENVTIKVGGKTFPAIMVDGKVYGPIRDVTEALGHRVTWYENDRIVKVD